MEGRCKSPMVLRIYLHTRCTAADYLIIETLSLGILIRISDTEMLKTRDLHSPVEPPISQT